MPAPLLVERESAPHLTPPRLHPRFCRQNLRKALCTSRKQRSAISEAIDNSTNSRCTFASQNVAQVYHEDGEVGKDHINKWNPRCLDMTLLTLTESLP